MECEWKLFDEEKPPKTGTYLVLWNKPYSETMYIQSGNYSKCLASAEKYINI